MPYLTILNTIAEIGNIYLPFSVKKSSWKKTSSSFNFIYKIFHEIYPPTTPVPQPLSHQNLIMYDCVYIYIYLFVHYQFVIDIINEIYHFIYVCRSIPHQYSPHVSGKLLYEQPPPTCLAFILSISYPPYDGVDDNKSF